MEDEPPGAAHLNMPPPQEVDVSTVVDRLVGCFIETKKSGFLYSGGAAATRDGEGISHGVYLLSCDFMCSLWETFTVMRKGLLTILQLEVSCLFYYYYYYYS